MTIQQILLGVGGASGGQQEYTSAGTYTWTAPAGVTSISVVAVGSGAATGNYFINVPGGMNMFQGGGGGALAYKNNITVVPGNNYEVIVSAVGTALGVDGGAYSQFRYLGTIHVRAGSANQNSATTGGGPAGLRLYGTGYPGGAGGANTDNTTNMGTASGAGAGGYGGSGGDGLSRLNANRNPRAGNPGAGGAGGGGGIGWPYTSGGGGGGVGLQGQGANGAGGSNGGSGGGGGSGGTAGGPSNGGVHGGGGGYWGGGGIGGVRIIWPGDTRQFPSTQTADV